MTPLSWLVVGRVTVTVNAFDLNPDSSYFQLPQACPTLSERMRKVYSARTDCTMITRKDSTAIAWLAPQCAVSISKDMSSRDLLRVMCGTMGRVG